MAVVTLSYFELCGLALLGYDFCLTFSQEVERIWRQKLTGPIILFLVNRYLGLIYQITCFVIVIDMFDPAISSAPTGIFMEIVAVILVIICEILMTLRVYALYGHNNTILGFLLSLIIAQVVLAVCFDFVPAAELMLGEHIGFLASNGFTTNSFVLWISALVIDTSVFILTLRKTHEFSKDSQSAPLLHLFFRDGIVYFLVIGTSNLMNILVNVFFLDAEMLLPLNLSSQFCTSITSLLVSRLVLNIRIQNMPDNTNEYQKSTISSLVIGNMGGTMDELFDEDIDRVGSHQATNLDIVVAVEIQTSGMST